MSPYKNPEDQKAYMASYRKKKGNTGSTAKKRLELKEVDYTSTDLKQIITAALYELVDTPMDPAQRSRCLAQLVGAAIKLQMVDDMEQRMVEIENRLGITAAPVLR